MQSKEHALPSQYTRFGINGPAAIYVDTPSEPAFVAALTEACASGWPWVVNGWGSNLMVPNTHRFKHAHAVSVLLPADDLLEVLRDNREMAEPIP